jgi:hypothetical protein
VPGHRIRGRDVLVVSRAQAAMGLLVDYSRVTIVIGLLSLRVGQPARKLRFRLSINSL